MSEAFTGEMRIFGFNFAPVNWAACNGQIMAISQNTALFSLLGTYFGGDGIRTFGLPNYSNNVAIGTGTSSQTGTQYVIGETGGVTSVLITSSNVPMHTHALQAANARYAGTTNAPAPTFVLAPGTGCKPYIPAADNPTPVPMAPSALEAAGGTASPLAHNNIMPWLAVNYCVCLYGVFPSRN